VFSSRRLYLLKNSLTFYCRRETIPNTSNTDIHLYAEETWIKKILKLHESFFITALIVKAKTVSAVEDFSPLKEY
jgi:hypothetical protein